MPSTRRLQLILLFLACFLFLGDADAPRVTVLAPTLSDSVSYDPGMLLLVSVAKEAGTDLLVSTQWEREVLIDLSTKEAKTNLAKTFLALFQPGMTLSLLEYRYRVFKGYTKPDAVFYTYADTMSVRALWKTPEFLAFMKKTQEIEATSLLLTMKGWQDSLHAAVYDDPAADSRSLFKLHVQLVPGRNDVYLAPSGLKSDASVFTTIMKSESKPAQDREARFHNSKLEEGCHACHEGLPGASAGAAMTADCSVCHKAKFSSTYIHGPSEMKECGSCHSWSAEKNAVVVEKSVPDVCYECHADKKPQVESSASPHPVAGDCLGCHSAHGSDEDHLLKKDVYRLCLGCHEEYGLNHPVGRHPVRHALLKGSSQEISCATCHNPHGSPNAALLTMPGGRMESCSQCH